MQVDLCAINAVALGEVVPVIVADHPPFAVYNLDGEYFVTQDACSHGDASLAEGDVEGDEIVCPFHFGAFDIRSGIATRAPCVKALATYPVTVIDGRVCIDTDG